MSLFEDRAIADHALSRECYEYGQRLVRDSCVKSLNLTKKGADDFLVTSRVDDYGRLRIPSALLMTVSSKNRPKHVRILASSCSCEDADSPTHFCAHITAMLSMLEDTFSLADADEFLLTHKSGQSQDWLAYAPQTPAYHTPEVQTSSRLLLEAMDDVAKANRNRLCQLDAHGEIELEPTLHIESDREYIDFRIGKDTMYVVKDLHQLLAAVNKQKEVTYGKKLSFVHTPSAFTPNALRLLALLDRQPFDSAPITYLRTRDLKCSRMIYADATVLDELFSLYEGHALTIDLPGRQAMRIPVIKANPRIQVDIYGRDEEAYIEFSIPPVYCLEGTRRKYILYQNTLYICSQEYSQAITDILPLMMHNLTQKERLQNLYLFSDRVSRLSELRLYREDYPNFCNTLLPVFTDYTRLSVHNIRFDNYMIEEGLYDFYLDLDEKNNILCEAKATYDGHVHNLLSLPALDETYRDIRAEYELRQMLNEYFTTHRDKYYVIPADDLERQADFIENGISKLQSLADLYASESFRRLRVSSQTKVHTGLSIKGNLLEVTWDLNDVSDSELDQILQSYHRKRKYFRLKNGEILNLEQSGFGVLSDLQENLNLTKAELRAGMTEVPAYRSLYLDLLVTENASRLTVSKDQQFLDFMARFDTVLEKTYALPDVNASLRPYQIEGYHWASALSELGLGGILADDMGLGKTLQMLTYLKSKPGKTHLVVCPASLVYNWANECHRFTPDLRVLIVAGNATERQEMLEHAMDYDLLITSYDLLRRDIDCYQTLDIDTEIIDEAQNIKNPRTQSAKAVRAIPSHTRFALTGTPIENRLSELWSIFEYLLPGFFFSYDYFKEHFEEAIMSGTDLHDKALTRLQKLIAPFILRRLKQDVLTELPDKIEEVIYSKFDKKQEQLYLAHEKRAITAITASNSSDKLQILAELMKLRQLCCDPSLLYQDYDGESAKLETCIELIKNGVEGGHRILLFSQFTSMLSIIESRLSELNISYYKLTGETSKLKRRNLVESFQNGGADVFLISLKAGGTGLNLTAADTVIHYDPWWNVAAQNQATDRSHRIGQDKNVTVFKLIASNTIEERILKLQEKKKDMADKIISADGMSLASLSKENLLLLFRSNEND